MSGSAPSCCRVDRHVGLDEGTKSSGSDRPFEHHPAVTTAKTRTVSANGQHPFTTRKFRHTFTQLHHRFYVDAQLRAELGPRPPVYAELWRSVS
jgi:hypothetical protein